MLTVFQYTEQPNFALNPLHCLSIECLFLFSFPLVSFYFRMCLLSRFIFPLFWCILFRFWFWRLHLPLPSLRIPLCISRSLQPCSACLWGGAHRRGTNIERSIGKCKHISTYIVSYIYIILHISSCFSNKKTISKKKMKWHQMHWNGESGGTVVARECVRTFLLCTLVIDSHNIALANLVWS